MDHYITAISSHCNGAQKGTVHWIMAVCKCGAFFTETTTSSGFRETGLRLSSALSFHIAQSNQHAQLSETSVIPKVVQT